MELQERIEAARSGIAADLLLTNCRIVDVLSGRVHPGCVAVRSGIIVGLDEGYPATEEIDLGGMYVAPGLLDAHVHLESSMVAPDQFARAVVPRGTTAVFTDCHEIANVMGIEGIEYMMRNTSDLPLDVFVMLPPCVPATPLETSGAVLEAADLEPLLKMPQVLGLGELMNFPGTIAGDSGVLAKLRMVGGRPVDGHCPGLTGTDLAAYVAAGPDSDHECTTVAEAEEKLQKGMYVFLREGTGARNLLDLLPVANASNSSRLCLCTDDRHPADLLERGHIDSMLRMVTGAGFSPLTAVQLATVNTAGRFRLRDRGAVAVGRRADLVVFEDLDGLEVKMVFKDGRLVAKDGELKAGPQAAAEVPPTTFDTGDFSMEKLRLSGGTRARVIGVLRDQIVTDSLTADVKSQDGAAVADPDSDLLKVAVVERHRGTGNVGVAFVKGFGLKSGALASSVAHDSHNIVVVGTSDADITAAVEAVVQMGGGQAVVAGGEVLSGLALPIAGLMSPGPLSEVADRVDRLHSAAASLGCSLDDPFMTMSFLALPVIPKLKLTDLGLVDVDAFAHVPLFV